MFNRIILLVEMHQSLKSNNCVLSGSWEIKPHWTIQDGKREAAKGK